MDWWSQIEAVFLAHCPEKQRSEIRTAIGVLKKNLQGTRLGRFVSRNFQLDPYLSRSEKAKILELALFYYDRSRRIVVPYLADPRPVPIPSTSARKAMGLACGGFEGRGGPIPCCSGEFCHYLRLGKIVEKVDTRGAQGGFHSESVDTWIGELGGDEVKYDHPILSRVGKVISKEYVFSTRSEWVDSSGLHGGALSAWLRDLLGCPHFEEERIIELRLPEHSVRNDPVLKPTFADARGFPPFSPSRPSDRFGSARDLRTRRRRPGGPELWNTLLLAPGSGIRLLPPPMHQLAPGPWKELADECRSSGLSRQPIRQSGGLP